MDRDAGGEDGDHRGGVEDSPSDASASAKPANDLAQVEAVRGPERRALHQHAEQDHRKSETQHGEEDVAVAPHQEAEQKADDTGKDPANGTTIRASEIL